MTIRKRFRKELKKTSLSKPQRNLVMLIVDNIIADIIAEYLDEMRKEGREADAEDDPCDPYPEQGY